MDISNQSKNKQFTPPQNPWKPQQSHNPFRKPQLDFKELFNCEAEQYEDTIDDNDEQQSQTNSNEQVPMEIDPPHDATDSDSMETVHSGQGDAGKAIPLTEKPINVYQNRIILNTGETFRKRLTRPFNRYTHFVTISKNTPNEDIAEFIREYFHPQIT